MKFRLLLGAALGVVAVVVLILSRRDGEPHSPGDVQPSGQSVARTYAKLELAHEAQRTAAQTLVVGDANAVPNGLTELLARLRELAPAHDYHERAWPIVEAIADLGESVGEQVAAVALSGDADVDRVRSACAVALGLGRSPAALRVAEHLLAQPSPELERGGWIALGLMAADGAGMPMALVRFENPTGLRTYPATIASKAAKPLVDRAIRRVLAPVPEALMEVSLEPDGNLPRFEEQFTRCIIVLAVLGPATGEAGSVRDTMLRWLRGVGPFPALAEDAVMHCLALAAKADEGLAVELLDVAAAHLFEPDGTSILEALVRLGGQGALVLDHLRGFFASEEAIEGDVLFALTQVQAIAALMPLLGAVDPLLRQEAATSSWRSWPIRSWIPSRGSSSSRLWPPIATISSSRS